MCSLRLTARTFFLLAGGCLIAPAVGAEDWPTWMGPFAQNRSAERSLAQTFDRDDLTNIKWATRLGTVAFGTPTVSGGRVFVGTNYSAVRDDRRFAKSRGGVLVCLDEATGEVLWRLVTPLREEGFPEDTHLTQQRWGICSSPTVEEDRIYVITNGDDLLCVDVHGMANGNDGPFRDEARFMARLGKPPIEVTDGDADIIWRFDIPRELSVAPHDVASSSVLIDGDVLYLSTSNGLGAENSSGATMKDAPAFIALDKRTGRLLAVEDEHISETLFHAQWSSASKGRVGDRTLIFLGGGNGICYAFEAVSADEGPGSARETGRLKTVWKYDCNPRHYRFTEEGKRIGYNKGDLRVYTRSKRADALIMEGLNSGDGSYIGPSEIIATPVFYEDRVYVATGRDPLHGLARGALHCIDATQTGDITESGRVWSYEDIGRTLSSVAIEDGLVYAADLGGRLHCLDAATGEVYWIHDTREESWGNPLIADGRIYFNTTETFWILAAGKQKEVLFSHRGGSEVGAVAANGVVYAFMKGRLYAIADGIKGSMPTGPWPLEQDAKRLEDNENLDDSLAEIADPSVLEIPEPSDDPSQRMSLVAVIVAFVGICMVFVVWAVLRSVRKSRNDSDT